MAAVGVIRLGLEMCWHEQVGTGGGIRWLAGLGWVRWLGWAALG